MLFDPNRYLFGNGSNFPLTTPPPFPSVNFLPFGLRHIYQLYSMMGASYTQQQPPPDLLASSAPLPSAAASSAGAATAASHHHQQLHHQQQQQRRKASCPKLGENIVMLICLSRVRRMGGRWYRAVSHMRTGKRKKEKKRPYRPADFDRMTEASNAAMDMSETDLAEIVANLLKKVFKEIQDDCREAFVRAWLREDDTRCVLTVPDGKGKMKRIDGLRGSDKVWRLDTLVAMLYHGVPMDSTDTGLLVHRCEDELCVNPRHLSFQCSPAMMAVAMEMLCVAGYDVTPRLAAEAAAAADPSGNCRYFQFTSPFTVDVIRREMSESMALPQSVLDRYQLSADDAAYVQDNFPETMTAYRRLLSGGGASGGGVTGGAASTGVAAASAGGIGAVQQQQQQQQQHHPAAALLRQHGPLMYTSSAAGLLLKSEAMSPASCSSASATPSSAASAGGGVKRPPSESPTNAQMPLKKRRPMSSTDFTPVASAVSGYGLPASGGTGIVGFSSSLHEQRPGSDEGKGVGGTSAAQPPLPPPPPPPPPPPLPSQSMSHFDSHNQLSYTAEDEVEKINRPAAVREAAATLCILRNSPIYPELGGYSVFSEGLSSIASLPSTGSAASVAAAAAAISAPVSCCAMPAPPSAPPLPRPRPLVQRLDGTLAERDSSVVVHAGASASASLTSTAASSATTTIPSSNLASLTSQSLSALPSSIVATAAAASHRVFRPILPPESSGGPLSAAAAAALILSNPRRGSTTPVGHSPLLPGRNDTPTAIRLILEMQSSQSGGGVTGGGGGGGCDPAVSGASGAAAASTVSGRLAATRGGGPGGAPSIDQFEHMLCARPGATPTWPFTSGAIGDSSSSSSPVKLSATAMPSTAGGSAVGTASSAASTEAATKSGAAQRRAV